MKRCSSIAVGEPALVQESFQIPKVLKVKHIGHKPARPKNLVSHKFTTEEIKAGASPTSAKQENEAKPFAPTKQYESSFTSPTNQEIKAGASPTLPTSFQYEPTFTSPTN